MSEDRQPRPIDVLGQNVAGLADRVDSLNVQVMLLLVSVMMLAGLLGGVLWRLSRVAR